jgi:hypothetical protein
MMQLTFVGGLIVWLAGQTGLLAVLPPTVQTAINAAAALAGVLGIRAAAPGDTIATWLGTLGAGWKTATGAAVAALGVILSPDSLAILTPATAHLLTVLGTLLAALGLYHAQAGGATVAPSSAAPAKP